MADEDAKLDQNRHKTLLAVSDAAGAEVRRLKVADATDRLKVDADITSGAEYAEDSQHSSGDTGNLILAVRKDTAAALAGTDGDYIPVIVDSTGHLYVNVGNTVTADVTGQGDVPITLDGETVPAVVSASATATGCSMHFDSDGDNTAQVIKAAAGRLYGLEVSNPNSADAYIQLFDVAAGSVTVGTTTPNLSFLVPAGDGTKDGAMDKSFVVPVTFATAITYACTTTATGSGDPTTGLIVNATYL